MKKIISLIILAPLFFVSCQEDVLDKKPLDLITDAAVWDDQALVTSYLAGQYMSTSVFTNESPYSAAESGQWTFTDMIAGPFAINEIADEGRAGWGKSWLYNIDLWKGGNLTISGGMLEWWEIPYRINRALNIFIEKVPNSQISDESFKKIRVAEARWLRAFNYFYMVKRYGGVPLITKAQSLEDTEKELFPSRTSEKAIYDFVISEMDAIAGDLPETGYDRPSKYAALALKCRAALYAGSIAKYGSIQLNGLLGIPASEAQAYFQKSYDAAKAITGSGKFALYNKDADKVTNFKNMWLVKKNGEQIFVRAHDAIDPYKGGNSWSYDFFQSPAPQAWGAGNMDSPYLEMAEEFEYIDGRPGTLDKTAITQGLWTISELWGGRDPRFYASIYTTGTPWKGILVDWHKGLILPDGTTKLDGSYNGVLANGKQYYGGGYIGFGVLKYMDERVSTLQTTSLTPTDYAVFRYAEILLNLAEAAFELNKSGEALDAVNLVRARAGISLLSSIDMDKIRHERKIELAYEGHRYWDLRRWRIAQQVLSVNRSGLRYILDYTTKKYKLEVLPNVDGTGSANPLFRPYYYYLPITLARTGQNPNLVENPGYQ